VKQEEGEKRGGEKKKKGNRPCLSGQGFSKSAPFVPSPSAISRGRKKEKKRMRINTRIRMTGGKIHQQEANFCRTREGSEGKKKKRGERKKEMAGVTQHSSINVNDKPSYAIPKRGKTGKREGRLTGTGEDPRSFFSQPKGSPRVSAIA